MTRYLVTIESADVVVFARIVRAATSREAMDRTQKARAALEVRTPWTFRVRPVAPAEANRRWLRDVKRFFRRIR